MISTEPLFCPHWYNMGIHSPVDLIKSDGNIMAMAEIKKFYKLKTNFLECLRVQKCMKAF